MPILRVSILTTLIVLTSQAAQAQQPVRMGSGAMTFDTVPGWGLDEDGKPHTGSTHGGVVIDRDGNIYFSANIGVFVFTPDGQLIRKFVGEDYESMHDIEIRTEGCLLYTSPSPRD